MAIRDQLNALVAERKETIGQIELLNSEATAQAKERNAMGYEPDQYEQLENLLSKQEDLNKRIELETRKVTALEQTERSAPPVINHENPDQSPGDKRSLGAGSMGEFVHWVPNGLDFKGQYRESWELAMPHIENGGIDPDHPNNRALATTAANAGATTIPGNMIEPVVSALYATDMVRATPGVRVVSTPTGNPIQVPIMARPVSGGNETRIPIVAEGSGSAEWTPALTGQNVPVYAYRGFLDVSDEMMEDAGGGLMAELPGFIVDALMGVRGFHNTVGSGTNQPQGLFSAAPTTGDFVETVAAATGGVFPAINWGEWINFVNILPVPYRPGQMIHMGRQTLSLLQSSISLDGTNTANTLVFQPNAQDGLRPTLYGVPIMINEFAPTRAATTNIAVIFNPRYAVIRDVRMITVRRNLDLRTETGQVRLEFAMRGGFRFINPGNGAIGTLRQL